MRLPGCSRQGWYQWSHWAHLGQLEAERVSTTKNRGLKASFSDDLSDELTSPQCSSKHVPLLSISFAEDQRGGIKTIQNPKRLFPRRKEWKQTPAKGWNQLPSSFLRSFLVPLYEVQDPNAPSGLCGLGCYFCPFLTVRTGIRTRPGEEEEGEKEM